MTDDQRKHLRRVIEVLISGRLPPADERHELAGAVSAVLEAGTPKPPARPRSEEIADREEVARQILYRFGRKLAKGQTVKLVAYLLVHRSITTERAAKLLGVGRSAAHKTLWRLHHDGAIDGDDRSRDKHYSLTPRVLAEVNGTAP